MHKREIKQDQVVQKLPGEYYNLSFEPIIQQNKLFIKAYDDKTNVLKYQGWMDLTTNMNIDFICKSLKKKENLQIETNQDELKIYLCNGAIKILFKSVQKLEKNALYERLRKLQQRQDSYKQTTDRQSNRIDQLQRAMGQLKQSIRESLQSEINEKLNTINFRLDDNSITLGEHENQLRRLNDQKLQIDQFIVEKQILITSIDSQKEQLQNMEIKYQPKLTQISQQVIRLSFQNSTRANEIKSISSSLDLENNKISQKINQLSCLINTRANEIKSISSCLDLEKNKISKQNLAIQKMNTQIKIISPFPWGISHLNQPIKSTDWSTQLKSENITISGNVVKIKKKIHSYREFCLLNASFSNTLKQKQSWTIKINKITRGIGLGVCLKSKMIEYNFNSRNINWKKTDHGLYINSSGGFCYSHSQKEFNCENKSFEFDSGDVIYVEYDPIDLKLRFSKNKVDKFEMPIIAPPKNDAYHPCVGLDGQNDSIELIPWC